MKTHYLIHKNYNITFDNISRRSVGSPHEAVCPAGVSSDGAGLRDHVGVVVPDLLAASLHVEARLVLGLPELLAAEVAPRAAVARGVGHRARRHTQRHLLLLLKILLINISYNHN